MKFRLVDRITGCESGRTIAGEKSLSLEEYFLLRPAGFSDIYPPALMAESFFQLSNFLIFRTTGDKLGWLVMFKKMVFHGYMRPGDTMKMKVDVVSVIDDAMLFRGTGEVNGLCVIEGHDFMARLIDARQLVNPEKYGRLFDSLYSGPAGGL